MEPKSDFIPGIVVSSKANFVQVEIDHATLINLSLPNQVNLKKNFCLLCTSRNRLNHRGTFVNVGDFVWVEAIDWKAKTAVVAKVEPRKNFLHRPAVANVSNILVVISLSNPKFDLDQTTRFLLAAEQLNLDVRLVISKIDLVSREYLHNQLLRFQDWGYLPIGISVKTGEGLNKLKDYLHTAKLTVLCGPSGVGKTSLLNFLLPNSSLKVGSLSGRLQRGRHTTRNVELFTISNGSRLADTPGFNRPEYDVNPIDLACLFPELRSQLSKDRCRFRDCLHLNEPGCVVNRKLERYPIYRSHLQEIISLKSQIQVN